MRRFNQQPTGVRGPGLGDERSSPVSSNRTAVEIGTNHTYPTATELMRQHTTSSVCQNRFHARRSRAAASSADSPLAASRCGRRPQLDAGLHRSTGDRQDGVLAPRLVFGCAPSSASMLAVERRLAAVPSLTNAEAKLMLSLEMRFRHRCAGQQSGVGKDRPNVGACHRALL